MIALSLFGKHLLHYASFIWNNPVTRYIAVGLAFVFGILLYGLIKEKEGRDAQKRKAKAAAAKKRAAIETAQKEQSDEADTIRDDAGSYDDDSVSDAPAPNYHYRED